MSLPDVSDESREAGGGPEDTSDPPLSLSENVAAGTKKSSVKTCRVDYSVLQQLFDFHFLTLDSVVFVVRIYLRGSFDNTTSSIHTVPLPFMTRFSVTLSGFCPFWKMNGVLIAFKSVFCVTTSSIPREKY